MARPRRARRAHSRRSWWPVAVGALVVAAILGIVIRMAPSVAPEAAPPATMPLERVTPMPPVPTSASPTPSPTPKPTPTARRQHTKWKDFFVSSKDIGTGDFTVAVLAEQKLGDKVDVDEAAQYIYDVLSDPRGWGGDGVKFSVVTNPDAARMRINISTPDRVDAECLGVDTHGYVSCRMPGNLWLNSDRWLTGVPHIDDLQLYRGYLVSHEVGHELGYGHVGCPGPGQPAPVMLQQTYHLQGCVANQWVHPDR